MNVQECGSGCVCVHVWVRMGRVGTGKWFLNVIYVCFILFLNHTIDYWPVYTYTTVFLLFPAEWRGRRLLSKHRLDVELFQNGN